MERRGHSCYFYHSIICSHIILVAKHTNHCTEINGNYKTKQVTINLLNYMPSELNQVGLDNE